MLEQPRREFAEPFPPAFKARGQIRAGRNSFTRHDGDSKEATLVS